MEAAVPFRRSGGGALEGSRWDACRATQPWQEREISPRVAGCRDPCSPMGGFSITPKKNIFKILHYDKA
uniref:Uncharacterized protein n=1 Tax=Leersia perrieri TaxID=77586 RepID=A0A0D9XDZ0_9ORYZ